MAYLPNSFNLVILICDFTEKKKAEATMCTRCVPTLLPEFRLRDMLNYLGLYPDFKMLSKLLFFGRFLHVE